MPSQPLLLVHQFSVTALPMVMECSCSFFWCFRGHKFVCFDGPIIHFYSLVLYYTNYLAVHKPKFALVQDEALCGQKSQCSG